MEDTAKLLHGAHARVRAVRESLRQPGPAVLSRSWPLLQEAIDQLSRLNRRLEDRGQGRDAALKHSALELRRELSQLGALLESSADFTAGWTRRLSAMVSGYTPQGAHAPLDAGRRILVEG
jgi:hypothetical protein